MRQKGTAGAVLGGMKRLRFVVGGSGSLKDIRTLAAGSS